MEKFCRLILIALISFLPSCPVAAAGLSSHVTARFENYYLDDALVMLSDDAGLSWAMCGPVRGSITRTIDNIALSQVLGQIAKANRLTVLLKPNIVIIRTAAKPPVNTVSTLSLTKLPLTDALKGVGDVYGLAVSTRGKLKGDVNDELSGTMKEVMDVLAAKYHFKWTVSHNTLRVTAVQTK